MDATKGGAGTGGAAGTRSGGPGSNGTGGNAGASPGLDGSVTFNLLTGATLTTTGAAIQPAYTQGSFTTPLCQAPVATTLTVTKTVVPASDAGLFNLQIDGSTAGSGGSVGDGGTTGAVSVTAAEHTVSESAGTGTDLTNYDTVIGGDCASDGKVTLAAGDAKTCTITNSRKPTLTVIKTLLPSGDAGKFNLEIDGSTAGTGGNIGNGGTTGAVKVSAGVEHTVGESAVAGTNLTDYVITIGGDCTSAGKITLAAGENKTCTITNSRKSTLTVNKTVVPASDPGLFNLQIDGVTYGGPDKGDGGTTGAVEVASGIEHTVGESAGTGTSLGNYVATISGDCDANGNITLAPGDNKTCTITNTRVISPSDTATMWVGLKNSDDIGTNFDVIVELIKNSATIIASGIARCEMGINRTTPKAVTVPLTVSGTYQSGDQLTLRTFARIGTNADNTACGGHANAVGLRLYYDATTRASQAASLFLHSDGTACTSSVSTGVTNRFLDGIAPTATAAKCQDSAGVAFAGGNVRQLIGGDWTMTVP